MKKNMTRNALFSSLMSLLLCASMLVGTTFAWFTDSVTSSGNIIKSGTLNVSLTWADKYEGDATAWKDASTGAIFDYKLWEPGFTQVRYVKLANEGTLAFKYQLNIIPDVTPTGAYNLADVIDVYMVPVDGADSRVEADAVIAGGNGNTLSELMADPDGAAYGAMLPVNGNVADVPAELQSITTVGELSYCIILHMQETAGNEYQDLSVGDGFSVQLLATQLTAEKDSFGPDYDSESEYEDLITVSSSAGLANAIKNAPVDEETVITLAPGDYSGDIDITQAAMGKAGGDLVFKAADDDVVISGTVTMGYFENRVGATAWNGHITFDGITFDHAEAMNHSLVVQNVKDGVTLRNCVINGDGEYGISAPGSNPTGPSVIEGCTFNNAGIQAGGNFATGLVIDRCIFNSSCLNVQGGNSVTVQNCSFDKDLTAANVGDSFYLIRSNSTPITVKDCLVTVGSELTEVATAQAKWGIFWNRGTTDWTVENVEVILTPEAQAQTELLVTKTTSTGVINTNNLTVR